MVSLEIVKSRNRALIKTQPLVAVITGATSGIGEQTVRTLANIHGKEGKDLRIYLVGRKEAVAKTIISECLKECPTGDFRFVQAGDLSLMRDVDHTAAEIIKAEDAEAAKGEKPRIDFLVMCHAFLAFEARQGSLASTFSTITPSILDSSPDAPLTDIMARNQRRP